MLVPTEETIDKLYELGFKYIGLDPFSGAVSVYAQIAELKPEQMKTLADMPGFESLSNYPGKMRLIFSGVAVEEMKE